MAYSITLIIKKETGESEAIAEIKKYIAEKEGKILSINELGKANLIANKKAPQSYIYKIETDISPENVEKVKKKISHEKEIVSYIFEKIRIFKQKKETVKKIKPGKAVRKKSAKGRSASGGKKEANKTKKVIASMQEEEKKIKDLDSTLDKILNE